MATSILKEAAGRRYNGVALLYLFSAYAIGFYGLFRPEWAINVAATLLLASASLLLFPRSQGVVEQTPQEAVVVERPLIPKGRTDTLHVAVQRNGNDFTLRSGDSLQTGDLLGFFYGQISHNYRASFFGES